MNTDNMVEIIEVECNLMRWIDDRTLKAQWRPLEEVLNKGVFRNKLREVRVKLSVRTNRTNDRCKIAVGFTDLFSSLRERGIVISVEDQGWQRNDQSMSALWNPSGLCY